MINVALFGAGRIGAMHARIIAEHRDANLIYVYDHVRDIAKEIGSKFEAVVPENIDDVFNDPNVHAILIATPTDTHIELIKKGAKHNKAIFCEKPIDLSCEKVLSCWEEIKDCDVPIQIGFNRRFDPTHSALRTNLLDGKIGKLEQLIITSRDPDIAPVEYLEHSGGIFRDMVIHDFDMARFIVQDEPVEIYATGSRLISPELERYDDVDTALVSIKFKSGILCQISVSRRCVFGYDQRLEAFGSDGMLQSTNPTVNALSITDSKSTNHRSDYYEFFIDRYEQAYKAQFEAFIFNLLAKKPLSPSFKDGLRAQEMADAAQKSFTQSLPVIL